MSLKEGEKYFHISEIFSFCAAGAQVYLPELSKMPNGEYRQIMLGYDAASSVAEHILGVKIWRGSGYKKAGLFHIGEIFDVVAAGLVEQLPWLDDINAFRSKYPVGMPAAELEKRRDWLRQMANEKLGGEWFILKHMPDIKHRIK